MSTNPPEPPRTVTLVPPLETSDYGVEPPVFLPQEVVAGRFRIIRPQGVGGMGQIFEVEDLELGTRVALKVLRPRATRSAEAERLLRREVQLARQVTHPHVCRIFDLVVHHPGHGGASWGEPGRPILGLTMELLEGETLEDRLCLGALPEAEALRLLRQLAAALDAVHAVGIYHCDFKPANVILTPSRAVVTDFGLACAAWAEDEGTGTALRGTPGYLAPEVLAGASPTAAADRYALGVVAHSLLTGRLPAEAASDSATALPVHLPVHLPVDVHAVMARALHADPAQRYPEAAALVRALEEALPRSASPPRRSWLAAALLLCALLPLWGAVSWNSPSGADPSSTGNHLEEARRALRQVEYARARAAADRAVATAYTLGETAEEAQGNVLLAATLEAMGEAARADEAMARARQLLLATGDRCGLARAGLVFRDTSDTERSPIPLEELPPLLAECGDPTNQAIALARLAKRRSQHSRPEGDRLLRQAFSLVDDGGDPRALAELWNVLGTLEYGWEDLRASEAAFARAVAEARRAEDPYLVAGILCNQSSLLNWLGRRDEGRAALEEATSLIRRIGNRYLLIRALHLEAAQLFRSEDLEQALPVLEESYELSLDLGDRMAIHSALQQLSRLHELQGRWRHALTWLHKAQALPLDPISPEEKARQRLRQARLHFKLAELESSSSLVTRMMEDYPLEGEADSTALYSRLQRVQIHLAQGEAEAAADLFQGILPRLVRKDEVGLRRDVAHLAVEMDQHLAEPRVVSAWHRLAAAAPLRADMSPEQRDHALQLRVDLGRLEWFLGDEAGAEERFRAVARQAQDLSRDGLPVQLAEEPKVLGAWQDYWRW